MQQTKMELEQENYYDGLMDNSWLPGGSKTLTREIFIDIIKSINKKISKFNITKTMTMTILSATFQTQKKSPR